MAVYRRGKYYHYDFTYRGARYKGSTEQTSIVKAREVESRKRREARSPVTDLAFEDLAEKYLKLHAATKRGQKFYTYTVRVLLRQFEGRQLSEITAEDVDEFMTARRAAVKPSTANRSLVVLKHIFKLGVRWGHLRENPAADARLAQEPRGRERFLTEDEAARLLTACTPWLYPIVLAAIHTGARQGELLGLRWEDVDLGRGILHFRRTKNGHPRQVRASETLRGALKGLQSRLAGEAVFLNHSGEPVHRDGLTWSFRAACRRASIVGLRFHDLRHSAASFLVQAGVPLNTVREILGHRSLAMTLRYAHLAPGHQDEAAATMDRIGGTAEAAPEIGAG